MTVLVIAEHDNATIKGATFNTITAAAHITLTTDQMVHVMVLGHNCEPVAQAAAQIAGVATVLYADSEGLDHGLAENMTAQILAVAQNYSHILFAATASGNNIAPRLAAKLDVGQISDITKVDSPDTFERPIYAGNAIATVQSSDAVRIITVRGTGFDAASASGGSAELLSVPAVAASVSGAIQHLAGMKDSKVILAINKGPEALIFSVADYGLDADLFMAVSELTAAL